MTLSPLLGRRVLSILVQLMCPAGTGNGSPSVSRDIHDRWLGSLDERVAVNVTLAADKSI